MAPPGENPEMVFIFDVNGFIAGMHSVVAKKFVISDVFNFDASKWYRSDNILGEDAFVTTAYFVDPAIICQGGRSQGDFDMEGTGNRVWFQNGATTADVQNTPLTIDEADSDVSPIKFDSQNSAPREFFEKLKSPIMRLTVSEYEYRPITK